MIEEIVNNNLEININDTILLDFYANWCGPCKVLSNTLSKLSDEKSDIIIKKINVEENELLCDQYQIKNLPYIICFKNGIEVWYHSGLLTETQLKEKLNA